MPHHHRTLGQRKIALTRERQWPMSIRAFDITTYVPRAHNGEKCGSQFLLYNWSYAVRHCKMFFASARGHPRRFPKIACSTIVRRKLQLRRYFPIRHVWRILTASLLLAGYPKAIIATSSVVNEHNNTSFDPVSFIPFSRKSLLCQTVLRDDLWFWDFFCDFLIFRYTMLLSSSDSSSLQDWSSSFFEAAPSGWKYELIQISLSLSLLLAYWSVY